MRYKLLLVDTDDFFKQHLGQRLRDEGFHLFFTRRLSDTKQMITRKKIDVALLNLSGLKREGSRIAQAIKDMNPLTEIVTVNHADQLAFSIDVMKLGAYDDFLIPIDINALIERVKAAAGEKKKNERTRSFLQRCEDHMMAAAFAEAGDIQTAKAYLENKTRGRKKQKGDKNG